MNAVNLLVSSGNSDLCQNNANYHGRKRKKIFKKYVIKNILISKPTRQRIQMHLFITLAFAVKLAIG